MKPRVRTNFRDTNGPVNHAAAAAAIIFSVVMTASSGVSRSQSSDAAQAISPEKPHTSQAPLPHQSPVRPTGVRGIVSQQGNPLPAVEVTAIKQIDVPVGPTPPHLLTKTTTDTRGMYSFEDLAPGLYALGFIARGVQVQPGRPDAQWQISNVVVCPGSMLERNTQPMGAFASRVVVHRSEGQQERGSGRTGMSGEVRGQAGNAVAGGRVLATRIDDHSTREAITDQSGAYVLDGLQPGAYTVVFSADGFVSETLSSATVEAGALRYHAAYLCPAGK